MVLGVVLRKCAWPQCKEFTYWQTPLQASRGKHGTCPDHAQRDPDLPTDVQAYATLARAFPGALVQPYRPERWPRGVYGDVRERVWIRSRFVIDRWRRSVRSMVVAPLDVGPCSRCQQPVRRYGDRAYPLCVECDEETRR